MAMSAHIHLKIRLIYNLNAINKKKVMFLTIIWQTSKKSVVCDLPSLCCSSCSDIQGSTVSLHQGPQRQAPRRRMGSGYKRIVTFVQMFSSCSFAHWDINNFMSPRRSIKIGPLIAVCELYSWTAQSFKVVDVTEDCHYKKCVVSSV